MTSEELRAQTDKLLNRLQRGETLDDILPDAFALVRETAKRTVGMRHFDVQLIGGMVLHAGKVAEMKTGEGKTLVATLPIYLNALTGQRRPPRHRQRLPGALPRRLDGSDLSCARPQRRGCCKAATNRSSSSPATPRASSATCGRPSAREAYAADITYGTNNEFGFDYLRDNLAYRVDEQVQRSLYYAIVDEVDNVFIDEARTPLIISGASEESDEEYRRFARIAPAARSQRRL